MIHDLYVLEMYYNEPEAAQSLEDTIHRYGVDLVTKALREGLLHVAPSRYCGFRTEIKVWLSDKGRERAAELAAL